MKNIEIKQLKSLNVIENDFVILDKYVYLL